MVLGLLGCKRSEMVDNVSDDAVVFSLSVEEMDVVQTKMITPSEQIKNLVILLFDDQGYFIGRYSTIKDGYQYLSNIPSSLSRKVMHFVANYDFANFEDQKNIGRTEAEVLMDLQTSEVTAFWARVVLDSGVWSTCLNGVEIKMIRNYAKFSFNNQTMGSNRLGTTDYCLINRSNGGTIAPFNTATGQFEVGVVTESPNAVINSSEWINVEKNGGTLLSYEQKSRGDQGDLFLLIHTKFISPSSPEGDWYFYKVALKNASGDRIDVVRNTHYIVNIKRVSTAGYVDVADAISNEPANDIDVEVDFFDHNSVSNGKSMLTVEKVEITTAVAAKSIELRYRFISDLKSGQVDNSGVQVQVVNMTNGIAIVPKSLSFANGVISFVTGDILPTESEVFQAQVIVTKDNLKRVVNVNLRVPYKFTSVEYNLADDPKAENKEVVLSIDVPNVDGLTFPMPIYISSPLKPNTAEGKNNNMTVSTIDGQIRLMYIAESAGVHKINMLTTSESNILPTFVEADNFVKLGTTFSSSVGNYEFSNPTIKRVGNKVVVSFGIPFWQFLLKTIDVNMYVNGLYNPVLTPSSILVTQSIKEMTNDQGYVFTTSSRTSRCEITFDVKNQGNGNYITLEADNFKSVTLKVPKN